jgi:hypothetical protein
MGLNMSSLVTSGFYASKSAPVARTKVEISVMGIVLDFGADRREDLWAREFLGEMIVVNNLLTLFGRDGAEVTHVFVFACPELADLEEFMKSVQQVRTWVAKWG